MFNLFKKKKEETKKNEENPISEVFSDLTVNQKMSVINLLLTMFFIDGEPSHPDKGMQYVNTYIKMLGVRYGDCNAYLKLERTATDLRPIAIDQKEFVFIALWEIMTINGRPSQNALKFFTQLFKVLGITDEKYIYEFGEKLRLMKSILNK